MTAKHLLGYVLLAWVAIKMIGAIANHLAMEKRFRDYDRRQAARKKKEEQ